MKLKLTNKEEFLVSMTQYLSNYYLPQKVNKILNDESKFMEIDILDDELAYFDLSLDDFVWDNDY
ncbi:hypothetical protein KJB62_12590 [Staphylococcus saprophyticus]|uniref:hypothetical protein n=1 Tax=Staphylococcus saprophyticus TaxID=29385 RepID=UPI001F2F444E|nr:hypothetical protein [Staphylococcus saprophyticus]MCE5132205.1 hypothetical protein [Staphylococcus saprophyticus]